MTMRVKMPEQIAKTIEELYENEGFLSQPVEKNGYYELSIRARDLDVLLDFIVSYNADNYCRYQVLFMCDSWDEDVVIAELGVNWNDQ